MLRIPHEWNCWALFTGTRTSTSQFLYHLKIGFSALLWCCLHVTLKRPKASLTKTVTLTVFVNGTLRFVKWSIFRGRWPLLGNLCDVWITRMNLLGLSVYFFNFWLMNVWQHLAENSNVLTKKVLCFHKIIQGVGDGGCKRPCPTPAL